MTGTNSASTLFEDTAPMIELETFDGKLNWCRWLLFGVVVIGFSLFFTFGPDEQTIIHRSAEWREVAQHHLFTALSLFFFAEVLLIAFSVPVGIWLTVLAGFLFGTWLGTAVVNVAGTIGAILAFLAARYVFADAIKRSSEVRPRLTRWLAALDEGFRKHGAYYVLLLRLTPIIPFFVVNLGLGLTSVRLRDYWWASQLGMLPISLVIANAGASLEEIKSFRDVLSLHVLGALSLMPLVPFVLHHTLGRWLTRNASHESP